MIITVTISKIMTMEDMSIVTMAQVRIFTSIRLKS